MSSQGLYRRLVRADRSGQSKPEQQQVARNGLRHLAANGLQAVGDQVVNARTVLPWLLSALGAPGALIALLVPVRESGSMLPQAWLAPVVERRARRAPLWVLGAAGQALAAAGMGLAAATMTGVAAGLVLVLCLALFSLARALCSLAGKDVLGRTVPGGQRGQINGLVTVAGGAVAITLGLVVRGLGDVGAVAPLAALLAGAAVAWVAALLVYRRIEEPVEEVSARGAARGDEQPARGEGQEGGLARSWRLLRQDPVLRHFVVVRSLLLVSALSPPFVVALAAEREGSALAGLGSFVIAQGVAALIGGRLFGRLADRSSRTLMAAGAGAAALVVLAFLALLAVPAARDAMLLYPAAYLLLALAHTGVRVARKTYVVDIAEGDRRTDYVAVSNTAMGVLLLVAGAVSGGLAVLGAEAALGFLSGLGLLGAVLGRRLPEAREEAATQTRGAP